MRRVIYWYLPLGVALTATVFFASGFYSFIRGDLGSPVELQPRKAVTVQQQSLIAPIILGDSVARGTGDTSGLGIGGRLDQELRRRNMRAKRTVNIAVNGARTTDVLRQLERPNVQTIIAQSNVVIISIGGNDLGVTADWRNSAPPNPDAIMAPVLDRISSVVRGIESANPRARIFIVGLYNPYSSGPFGARVSGLVNRWNARLMERFSEDVRVTIVQTADIFAGHDRLAFDRFHPGDEGYGMIARRIADAL